MSDERLTMPQDGSGRWWRLVLLIAGLCASRLAGLGHHLPHHDEMIHQWFSETLAFSGAYRVSPAYHGPLLYHLQAALMTLVGSEMAWARVVPAVAGILAALGLVALTWRESGRAAAGAAAVLVAVSPSWLYYARFDSHDTLVLLSTCVVAWGRWRWSRGDVHHATWLIVIGLALAWATKANALFIGGAIAAWPVVRWSVGWRAHVPLARLAWPRPAQVAASMVVALLLLAGLFISTYIAVRAEATTWTAALVDTIRLATVEPVAHWARMDRQQRLGGPFHYYGALLALYEPLLVAGALLALTAAWRQARHALRIAMLTGAAGMALAATAWPFRDVVQSMLHVWPVHLLVLPGLVVSLWLHARRCHAAGNDAGIWWAWMAASQTVLYSYAGEKVPWLVVHVALPWMMVAAPALADAWGAAVTARRVPRPVMRGLLVTCAVLTAYGALAVTRWTPNDPAEPLIQLQYGVPTHEVLARLAVACDGVRAVGQPCLDTTTEASWVASWYLRGSRDQPVTTTGGRASALPPFIFVPARRLSAAVPATTTTPAETHEAQAVRFALWGTWVEWLHRPRAADLAAFWWRRRSLGPRRGVPYELWVRRDLHAAWMQSGHTRTETGVLDDDTR